jgi:hypothetical protein
MVNFYTGNFKNIISAKSLIKNLVNVCLCALKTGVDVIRLKKHQKFAIALLLLVASVSQSFADTWDGTTITAPAAPVGNVYTIVTCANLAWVAQQVNNGSNNFSGYTLQVTNDLNLNNKTWTPIGYNASSSRPFEGIFDGQNHIISNVYVNINDFPIGFFGQVEDPGWTGVTIKNVKLQSVNITGLYMVGGLVGAIGYSYTRNETIQNCSVTSGTITSTGRSSGSYSYTGGLVGYFVNNTAAVSSCSTSVTVNSTYGYTGGLIGYFNNGGSISNSSATGPVSAGNDYVGGLIGYDSSNGTITNCFATGSVTTTNDNYVGGFIGYWSGNGGGVTSSYATGSVTGSNQYVGGFVGSLINSPTFQYCYAAGIVQGASNVGGFLGSCTGGTLNQCYATGNVIGTTTNKTAGFIGAVSGWPNVTDCTYDNQGTGQSIFANGTNINKSGITNTVGGYTTSQIASATPLWNAGTYWTFTQGYYPQLTAFYGSSDATAKAWSSLSVVPLNLDAADNSSNVNKNFTAPLTSAATAGSNLIWGNQSPASMLSFLNGSVVEYISLLTLGSVIFKTTDANGYAKTFYIKINTIPPPAINVSLISLTGFNYVYDFGPSALQSFVVNGTRLTNPITITPPTDYEVSKDLGVTYTKTPFTVPNNSNTTIYVRLKAGLAVGSYNSESIVLTSGSVTNNVTCSGFVAATSTFIVANGGINCALNTINLHTTASTNISNVYWTGPNNFYSTSRDPIINPVTSANTGDYIVTGSVLSGINLVTNGDFEAGNTGFNTAYLYAGTGSTALSSGGPWNTGEGQYTVVADPNSVHSGYSKSPDHTIGGPIPVGMQMVINGSKAANVTIWSETVPVQPNTNYQFTYWIQSVVSSSPPQLTFKINTVVVGPTFTAMTTAGNWTQYVYNWNSGANSSANLLLVNINTDGPGNDFALDDIGFQAITQVSALINVNVASTAPSLVIASASANPVNAGTMVTFTTKPTNGGTAPTYQWYVNGKLVTGAIGATYSYVPSNNDKVSCVMTPVGACVSTPVTSNTIIMTVNSVPNYWVGTASSTNWNIPTNWSAGFVPAPGDDVVFASPSNSYGSNALNDLYVDDNHTVGNLVNQTTNRKLVVSPNKNIVVNQQITSASADRIYIKSDSNLPNGSLIFSSSQTNPVYATVEMYSKATYDATGVQDPNTSLWYHYSWQYFGVPVASVTADPTFYGSFVRSYDESKPTPYQKWTSLGNSDVLVPFKGYEITQDAPTTIVFQGQLINTDKTITLTNTVATAYDPGQNILSNPYTGAIDIRKLVFDLSTTEPTVYLYNTGSFGAWATNTGYSETGYSSSVAPVVPGQYLAIPQNNAGLGTVPYDIPSMSGFLVKVKSGLGTLTIPYSSVITKNVNVQRSPRSQSPSDKTYIEISLHGEHYGDCMWLVEQPGTTRGFDSGWDGYKLSGAIGTPMLFAQEESGNYQISTSDDLNNTYLGFQAGVDLEDTLTFKHENLELKYAGVYLVDLVENKVVDITKSGTQYAFKAETTSTPVKRFKIVTEPYVKNAEDLMTRIKVFNDNNVIYVDNTSSEKGELHVYDTMGRCLKTGIFSANTISTFPLFSSSGIYIVKAVTSAEKVSKQIIVKY